MLSDDTDNYNNMLGEMRSASAEEYDVIMESYGYGDVDLVTVLEDL